MTDLPISGGHVDEFVAKILDFIEQDPAWLVNRIVSPIDCVFLCDVIMETHKENLSIDMLKRVQSVRARKAHSAAFRW